VKPDLWEGVAGSIGRSISPGQRTILLSYRDWLREEAIPAGGLGPEEAGRLEKRHIADSLLFYAGWERPDPPELLWDLGSGVGLPGIPLAVLLPETEVLLIDRSGRRVDLAKRAVRVLDLNNVTVQRAGVEALVGQAPMLVARAALPPDYLQPVMRRHLEPEGVAVVGGSWVAPPQLKSPGWEIKEIPRDSLDRPVWLLIMRG
jgi:16S rRNA G527 N7-methylase RsmG